VTLPLDEAKRESSPSPSASRGVRLASAVGLSSAGRVLRDFATYLPTQAVPALAGFVALPILARRLTPTDLGVLAIAQTLISLGWTSLGGWLAAAIVRELPASRARDADLGAFRRTLAHAVGVVAAAILAFAAVLGVVSIASSAIGQTLGLVVAALAALAVQNIAVSLFAAGLRPRAYALTEGTARVSGLAVGTALVFGGHGVSGYLVGLAVSSAVIGGIGLGFAWPRSTSTAVSSHPAALRSWVVYGLPMSAAAIVLWALVFVDRYLLALFEDAAAVGVYTVGSTLGDKVVMVPMFAFATASAPLLVTAFETRGRPEVERLLAAYARFVFLVGLPCIAYIAASGKSFVNLVSGLRYEEYVPAATVAPIVAAGSLLFALAGMANTGLAVAKQTKFLVVAAASGLAANVAANLVLIPWLGIKGAAIATPIGSAAYLLGTYWWSRRYAALRLPFATLGRAAIAAAAGYGAACAVTVSPTEPAVNVVLDAVVGLPVYVGVLALLGEHRRGETLTSA
jgi:O-antigen/teichoic acid export membrane protein